MHAQVLLRAVAYLEYADDGDDEEEINAHAQFFASETSVDEDDACQTNVQVLEVLAFAAE